MNQKLSNPENIQITLETASQPNSHISSAYVTRIFVKNGLLAVEDKFYGLPSAHSESERRKMFSKPINSSSIEPEGQETKEP